MRHLQILAITFVVVAINTAPVPATLTEFNWAVLFSGTNGRCYVRSEPESGSGHAGRTSVYNVERKRDKLLHELDWYSHSLFIECGLRKPEGGSGVSLVRMGSWSTGERPNLRAKVLSFYLDGRLLNDYSYEDIDGWSGGLYPADRRPPREPYGFEAAGIIYRTLGHRRIAAQKYVFEICTVDERLMTFDPHTGGLISDEKTVDPRCRRSPF
jgi:hypothetical protein